MCGGGWNVCSSLSLVMSLTTSYTPQTYVRHPQKNHNKSKEKICQRKPRQGKDSNSPSSPLPSVPTFSSNTPLPPPFLTPAPAPPLTPPLTSIPSQLSNLSSCTCVRPLPCEAAADAATWATSASPSSSPGAWTSCAVWGRPEPTGGGASAGHLAVTVPLLPPHLLH